MTNQVKAKGQSESKRKIKWTRKRQINLALLVTWIIFLTVTLAIPADWYGNYIFRVILNYSSPHTENLEGYRPVSYSVNLTLTTNGLWSAYNPIHVKGVIFKVNITNLLHDYHDLAFTNMSIVGKPLTLFPQPDGTFTTEGDIEYPQEIDTWVYLVPVSPTGFVDLNTVLFPNEFKQITSQPHVVKIGPQSDTLALQFNQFTAKLAFVFGSFSILFLQPVFEGLFISEEKQDPKEAPHESMWGSYHKLQKMRRTQQSSV